MELSDQVRFVKNISLLMRNLISPEVWKLHYPVEIEWKPLRKFNIFEEPYWKRWKETGGINSNNRVYLTQYAYFNI